MLLSCHRQKQQHQPAVWLYADMEGVNNITKWEEVDPAYPEYKKGVKLMTEEVNSAVKGLCKGGAREVFINDLHWFYDNLLWNKLSRGAISCKGTKLNLPDFFARKFEAVVIVGMHAMANTKDAVLPHSWLLPSYIQSLRYEQKFIGEIDLIKFIAEEKGVPTIFISGDRAGCAEATASIPEIFTVITKEKQGEEITLLPRKEVNSLIRKTSQEAMESFSKNSDPLTKQIFRNQPLEVTFGAKRLTEIIESRCKMKDVNYEKIDDKTLQFKGEVLSEIFQNFFSVLD